jgi:hypothetical protein
MVARVQISAYVNAPEVGNDRGGRIAEEVRR